MLSFNIYPSVFGIYLFEMELNLYGFGFWYGKLNVFNKNKNLLSNIYAMHKAQRKEGSHPERRRQCRRSRMGITSKDLV